MNRAAREVAHVKLTHSASVRVDHREGLSVAKASNFTPTRSGTYMKKSMAAVAASAAVAVTIGGVLYLGDAVGASPENEAQQDRAPVAAAAAPEIAAVPELSSAAVAGIKTEGPLIDVLSEAEAARAEGVVPRSEIVKNALAAA
ncbi:hypothetical protein ACLM5J_03770 [Nocardioides sp. Bht2]|uniref:hypothetical protein n=1 Tax=Nocardioides sp. Bht2 TaxID=3392297 RepID=UPI0039B44391